MYMLIRCPMIWSRYIWGFDHQLMMWLDTMFVCNQFYSENEKMKENKQ